eukprot:5551169-Amphidinium_carterae.1
MPGKSAHTCRSVPVLAAATALSQPTAVSSSAQHLDRQAAESDAAKLKHGIPPSSAGSIFPCCVAQL